MNEKYLTIESAIAAWNNEDLTLFLMKSKHSMPVGTLREFSGIQYRKVGIGNWQPVHNETLDEKDESGQVKPTANKPVDKKPELKKPNISINIKEEDKYKKMLENERGISEKQMRLITDLEKQGIKNYKDNEKYKALEKEKEDAKKKLGVNEAEYAKYKENLKQKNKDADKK